MFCLNVILTVKNEADVPRVRELLTECSRIARSEAGCVRYEACHSTSEPRVFILCERWESEQAWQDHRAGRGVQEVYLPHVIPLVDRTPHISTILE